MPYLDVRPGSGLIGRRPLVLSDSSWGGEQSKPAELAFYDKLSPAGGVLYQIGQPPDLHGRRYKPPSMPWSQEICPLVHFQRMKHQKAVLTRGWHLPLARPLRSEHSRTYSRSSSTNPRHAHLRNRQSNFELSRPRCTHIVHYSPVRFDQSRGSQNALRWLQRLSQALIAQ
jgi:hypothetical protein